VKDLEGAKEVVMKTKTNGGDLEDDEGLFVDLEDVDDEVTLKLDESNKVHIKKTGSSTFEVTQTVNGQLQTMEQKTSGASDYLGKMEYTLGSVTAELDETNPVISSGSVATPLVENSGAGQTVYTATAQMSAADTTEDATVTFTHGGADADKFSIDGSSGAVTLTADPDYDTQPSYTFTVTATDAAGNVSEPKTVSLTITNLDDGKPTFTSLATVTAIDENSGAGCLIYSAQATNNDTDGVASPSVTYSLDETGDHASFSINPTSGAVTLTANPNHEDKSSYSFTVIATDQSNNVSQTQPLSLTINNLDEEAPTFTSPTTVTPINENSGAGQVIYTAQATDNSDTSAGVTYSLAGTDAAFFTICNLVIGAGGQSNFATCRVDGEECRVCSRKRVGDTCGCVRVICSLSSVNHLTGATVLIDGCHCSRRSKCGGLLIQVVDGQGKRLRLADIVRLVSCNHGEAVARFVFVIRVGGQGHSTACRVDGERSMVTSFVKRVGNGRTSNAICVVVCGLSTVNQTASATVLIDGCHCSKRSKSRFPVIQVGDGERHCLGFRYISGRICSSDSESVAGLRIVIGVGCQGHGTTASINAEFIGICSSMSKGDGSIFCSICGTHLGGRGIYGLTSTTVFH
jgi:hypothetical protein